MLHRSGDGLVTGRGPETRHYDPVTTDEVHDAVAAATTCLTAAARLLEVPQLGLFR